jgi:NAD(P)-dependent dehydrogenase (short-subunit alcohol dehydrogenase family)
MNSTDFQKAFSLDGEAAIVTGGGSGLGLATAKCLVAAGARVAIIGRRRDVLESAVQEIGSSAVAIQGDISRLEELPQLVADVEDRVGPCSILVNNAGVHLKKPALETSDAEFQNVIQTHLSSSFALSREVARGMLQRGKGSIVLTGSMANVFGIPNVAAYSAAKSALVGLTRALAVEWSASGVRINAVVPGWIDSPMSRSALDNDPARKDKILSRTPMAKLGQAEDVGWATVYLCSRAAQFVTGTTLVIDGGVSIGF